MKASLRSALDALAKNPNTLKQLFDQDPQRFSNYALESDGLLVDLSKTPLDAETTPALLNIAALAEVEARRDAMWQGQAINHTEKRAVLHVALRGSTEPSLVVDGHNVAKAVDASLASIGAFVNAVHAGEIRGATGQRFSAVVNIGIGGSDLGPAMVCEALSPYAEGGLAVHFVSNVDAADIADTLAQLTPETTLIIVASKTFTTHETLCNAEFAKRWLCEALGDQAVADHFVALSSNLPRVEAFGIRAERSFGFWDWVGGRYSVWSAIGLSVALKIGMDHFLAFLDGARAMDQHFKDTPLAQNIPVMLALVGVYYRNGYQRGSLAILPYDQRLSRLPDYLQQLDMESNGKSVQLDGSPCDYPTGPVIWGSPGTNGQHAFYQLLHQGTDVIPCDFLVAANATAADAHQHDILLANCLAQSEALMLGKSQSAVEQQLREQGMDQAAIDALAPHKVFPGDRPSTTILYPQLTPWRMGQLIAMYEHKVFVQGVIWNINSFDQWGVELGKAMAVDLLAPVQSQTKPGGDSGVSDGLLASLHGMRAALNEAPN